MPVVQISPLELLNYPQKKKQQNVITSIIEANYLNIIPCNKYYTQSLRQFLIKYFKISQLLKYKLAQISYDWNIN